MFPLIAAFDIAGKIIDRVWPDRSEQDAAKLDILKTQIANEFQLQLGQIEVNKTEAANQNLFVAGWRPAIGWVCAIALGYQYLIRPLLAWSMAISGHPIPPMPSLDSNLWELMFGLLGLGALRTVEKVKGVS
jgi:hypothetical protein